MAIDPWTNDIRAQIQKFGDRLLALRKLLAAAKAAGVAARQLDMAEIDLLLAEYEKELRESATLQQDWSEKQPELEKLRKEAELMAARAKTHEIHNDEDYCQAQKHLEELDAYEKRITEMFDPYIHGFETKARRLESIYARVLAMCRLQREGSA